ncbi:MAG: cysteine desulfurase-like protein [Bacteroidetes bacterium CG12_big_fil_rev_8_21_14_0_65_60_17]|nr:MAG: cysteine desulfurase-like protein [Bacteroidetes bacterium CG12_big_fil_rev_8_21_14_0_65_60_17]
MNRLDTTAVRRQFPSIDVLDEGIRRIYLDNPGGTQICGEAVNAMVSYLKHMNANDGGHFMTSRRTDLLKAEAHDAMADLVGAESGDEIIFGQNMTSLTFSLSRSMGRELDPGDEIVVTRMDHDANVSPWLMLAGDLGLTVRWIDFNPETNRYDETSVDEAITDRTRIVAVNYASNALGTVNDVRDISARARAVGAWSYVDAVQYTPHLVTDVQAIGCDFLACSAYKFFGPHQGIVWGQRQVLERLTPYKVRPASNELPTRFETGTLSHEGMAGTLGAVEYLAGLGRETEGGGTNRRADIIRAFERIEATERPLCQRLLAGLEAIRGVRLYGPGSEGRVPTVAFTSEYISPAALARSLAEHNIFVWDGDYYAMEVIERLGLAETGGMLRVGLAHYNTEEEVDTFLDVVEHVSTGAR